MIFLKPIKMLSSMLLLFLITIALYIFTAFLLSFFPIKNKPQTIKEEKIYIVYDNVHSDIVFNLDNISEKWIKDLPILKNRKTGYIAFGWGDKETYLNTPTWDKIKISTSLKALFLNTPSLIHISYYPSLHYFIGVKPIEISNTQSKKIKNSILKSFKLKKDFYEGYGYNDLFYPSPYKYNFIYTCNTWTGNILRDADILMSYWTPFSKNVIDSLQ